jgi:hypothetical protein
MRISSFTLHTAVTRALATSAKNRQYSLVSFSLIQCCQAGILTKVAGQFVRIGIDELDGEVVRVCHVKMQSVSLCDCLTMLFRSAYLLLYTTRSIEGKAQAVSQAA